MHLPITIGVRRSFFLTLVVLISHIVAAVFLFLPEWPLLISVCGVLLTLISLVWSLRRCVPAVEELRLLADGHLECRLPGEEKFLAAELLSGATVHPALTQLRLICEERRLSVALLPDNAAAEDRRRLRVWLRWRASFACAEKFDSGSG